MSYNVVVGSMDEFRAAVRHAFETCTRISPVGLPCSSPQPWNDGTFKPVFQAAGERYVAPRWQFSAYPRWSLHRRDDTSCFGGMTVSVYVRDATMEGKATTVVLTDLTDLDTCIQTLVAGRDASMARCQHHNHTHVRNLGRCYNEYRCNDCGHVFQIDSGD